MVNALHDEAGRGSLSVNRLALPKVAALVARAEELGVDGSEHDSGVRMIDGGFHARGSVAAGVLVGQICMGGLGDVRLVQQAREDWPSSYIFLEILFKTLPDVYFFMISHILCCSK